MFKQLGSVAFCHFKNLKRRTASRTPLFLRRTCTRSKNLKRRTAIKVFVRLSWNVKIFKESQKENGNVTGIIAGQVRCRPCPLRISKGEQQSLPQIGHSLSLKKAPQESQKENGNSNMSNAPGLTSEPAPGISKGERQSKQYQQLLSHISVILRISKGERQCISLGSRAMLTSSISGESQKENGNFTEVTAGITLRSFSFLNLKRRTAIQGQYLESRTIFLIARISKGERQCQFVIS